jgi:uncharacterized protein (TIGR03000 family)
VLTVSVPAETKIFVNDRPTTTPGTERQYVSRGLERGYSYKYEVRAELERDGQTLKQTKLVDLHAGDNRMIAFDFSATETTLTVNVPENAKVLLAGHETKSSGAVRVFTTTTLAPGQEWSNYTVEVKVEREGQELTRSETITLKSGETRELSFDFSEPKVADNR